MDPDDIEITETFRTQPELIHLKNEFLIPCNNNSLIFILILIFVDLHLNKSSVTPGSESGGQRLTLRYRIVPLHEQEGDVSPS